MRVGSLFINSFVKRINLLTFFLLLPALSIYFFSCDETTAQFDPQAQLKNDIEAIDEYLQQNGINAYKDNSGIRFVINQIGTGGVPPKRSQSAKVIVTAMLFDETVVENTRTLEDGLGFFPTQGLVKGVEILPVGTKARLYVPSGLAYAKSGLGLIPPNTNLIYDVELVSVTLRPEEKVQLDLDSIAIDTHLLNNAIVAEKGPLGIRYTIQELATGISPFWYDKIKISYTGKLLSTGSQFYSGTVQPSSEFDSRVVDFLPGLQIAVQLLPQGSKATFYIPSTLAFGLAGAGEGAVPSHANLIYEINSVEIVE